MSNATEKQKSDIFKILKNLENFSHEISERSIVITEKDKQIQFFIDYCGFPSGRAIGTVILCDATSKNQVELTIDASPITALIIKIIEDRKNEVLEKKQNIANGILDILKRKAVGA